MGAEIGADEDIAAEPNICCCCRVMGQPRGTGGGGGKLGCKQCLVCSMVVLSVMSLCELQQFCSCLSLCFCSAAVD